MIGGTLLALAAAAVLPLAPPLPPDQPQQRELTVTTVDGQLLPATLRLPAHPLPGRPAMVLVSGAGPNKRDRLAAEAEAFTRAGVATLAYDKRTVGYSLTQRSYPQLAEDAAAAAAVLRAQPGVDADRVGYWGHSEGGWVAPLAVARDPRAAFLVTVGANGGPPLAQQSWAERIKIEHVGVRGSLVDAYAGTAYRLISGFGMFSEPYYDPTPVLRSLRLPVLGIWGDRDILTPPVESSAAFRAALDAAGNTHYRLETVAGAEHAARTSTSGWDRGADFAPGYVDLVASWTSAAAAGQAPPPSVVGAGQQPRPTSPVPPLRWYESVPVQIGAFLLMLAGFVGFGAAAAVRRLRGRSGPRTPRSARLLAGAGLLAVLGWWAYLGTLVSGSGRDTSGLVWPGLLVAGRPLPWLALQLVAVVAAGALVVTALRHRPVAGDRLRTGALLGAGAVFVAWAAWAGLLVP
jgi:pimeloyl-ACP methyl ester carboxylesterase